MNGIDRDRLRARLDDQSKRRPRVSRANVVVELLGEELDALLNALEAAERDRDSVARRAEAAERDRDKWFMAATELHARIRHQERQR